jgi:predicted secreted protein
MAATIKIKNSSTANAKPTSSDLVQGELAINVTDKKIFTEDSGGNIVELGANFNGFKNRIINGAMVIDQRNAGASVTVNSGNNYYAVDRFTAQGQSTDGVFTVQQVSDAPNGFTNSLKVTVTTADSSIGSTQFYLMSQRIEGYNVSDLGFGAAGASTVTLSFWAKA